MDSALAGLLGALVGGLASFAGTAWSNWLALKRERENRASERESESEKWIRAELQTSLLGATTALNVYISRFLGRSLEQAQNDTELVERSAEVKKWLTAVVLHYPGRDLPEYRDLLRNIYEANHTAIIVEKHAWAIRQLIVSLAVKYRGEYSLSWPEGAV